MPVAGALTSMFSNVFLEAAARSKNERQQLDRLLETVSPHERMVSTGIVLVLAVFVLWAFLDRVDRTVKVEGILLQPGARHALVSAEPGFLTELLVAPGDTVESGDPIARQTVPMLDREYAVLRERVALLRTQATQNGEDADTARAWLEAARVALLQMEARRLVATQIVSEARGVVSGLYVVPGDYVKAGTVVARIREEQGGTPIALLRVRPEVARSIKPGMQAEVRISMIDDSTRLAHGTVASVMAKDTPGVPASSSFAAEEFTHRIEVVLDDASGLAVPDGTPCVVRIVIDREPPAALFARVAR